MLERAQLNNLVGPPANPAIGEVYADITNPIDADPQFWSGTTWISMNPGSFNNFTGTVAINQGGTGQGTAITGFNALSPLTSKGDIIAHNGVNNIRFPIGVDGLILSANSAMASGLEWIAAGGGGSVTSVGLSMPAIFTVTNSPVVGAGTLTATLVVQAANTVFAGPTLGAAAAPNFRTLVAADIPSIPFTQVTGTVPINQGGTGNITATAAFNALAPVTTKGDLIAGNGANSSTRLGVGADGFVLTADSAQATGMRWAVAGGGGGGGFSPVSLSFYGDGPDAPVEDTDLSQHVWKFAQGLSQRLVVSFKIPDGFVAGSQLFLKVSAYSYSAINTILFTATTTLIRKNTDAVDSVTNQYPSTNVALTNTVSKMLREFVIDLTDGAGNINSVAPAVGDMLKIAMVRGTDTDTGDLYLLDCATEIQLQ